MPRSYTIGADCTLRNTATALAPKPPEVFVKANVLVIETNVVGGIDSGQ